MTHLVSVIIPTCRRSHFLRRAIESVLNQSYADLEVIVVDDNEPQSAFRTETARVMANYQNDPRVVYIQNECNLGAARARNAGIFAASGEFITFLDDDDVYLRDKVSSQVAFMVQNGLDMSFTDIQVRNQAGRLVDYRRHTYVRSTEQSELLRQHLLHHLTGTPTFMYRKSSLVEIGAFDEVPVGQEFHLMLKSIERDLRIGYLPVAHVIQYLHAGNRVSTGVKKLVGEHALYELKTAYFSILSRRERQYIRFRYFAVLMVASFRSNMPLAGLRYLVLALITSPLSSLRESLRYLELWVANRGV